MEEIFLQLVEKVVTNSPLIALIVGLLWKIGRMMGGYIDSKIERVLTEFACQGDTKKEMNATLKKLLRVQLTILSYVRAIDRRKDSHD